MEINTDRIDQMIAAHEKSGTYLGGIFNCRYDEAIAEIKKAINSGRFGTITFTSVQVPWWRGSNYYANSWHGTKELDGGGALMNQTIHMIDILQYLMGDVDQIKACTKRQGHPEIETEDTGVAVLKFKNKALGLIYGSTASFPGQNRRLEITGTRGTVRMVEDSITFWQFEEEHPTDVNILNRFQQTMGGGGVADPGAINYSGHLKNIKAFVEAIESNSKFEIDGHEARKAVDIISRIYKDSGLF